MLKSHTMEGLSSTFTVEIKGIVVGKKPWGAKGW